MKRHFSVEDQWMTSRHMKNASLLLIIRKMKFKKNMGYHVIAVRMEDIKNAGKILCVGAVNYSKVTGDGNFYE